MTSGAKATKEAKATSGEKSTSKAKSTSGTKSTSKAKSTSGTKSTSKTKSASGTKSTSTDKVDCPCGSGKKYDTCCKPFIKGKNKAETAEELMRSRYSAYVLHEIDYIISTNHPEKKDEVDRASVEKWSNESEWLGFNLIKSSKGTAEDTEGEIEFAATYIQKGIKQEHHELSIFKKLDDTWYFYDGKIASQKPVVRVGEKIGRNDPCPCGSGKKYKNCCGK